MIVFGLYGGLPIRTSNNINVNSIYDIAIVTKFMDFLERVVQVARSEASGKKNLKSYKSTSRNSIRRFGISLARVTSTHENIDNM